MADSVFLVPDVHCDIYRAPRESRLRHLRDPVGIPAGIVRHRHHACGLQRDLIHQVSRIHRAQRSA